MKGLTISWACVRLALGQIESGNNDHAIGRYGEVSRFQILPRLWMYPHRSPVIESDAWLVACTIIWTRIDRIPEVKSPRFGYAEIYAVWHRPSAFRRAHFHVNRLPRKIRERCERFANLCHEIETHEHP